MQTPRHQCLIYAGSPVQHLQAMCDTICSKLNENYRCLYLNSYPMVAGMRSYLAASGVDVAQNTFRTSLVLSSERAYLVDDHFDVDSMMLALADALQQARADGFSGLWATGDMTWEFGPDRDFSKLIEYEHRLDELILSNPDFGGICQYHSDSLPYECLHHGLVTHPGIFVNATLTRINPKYLPAERFKPAMLKDPELTQMLGHMMQAEGAD